MRILTHYPCLPRHRGRRGFTLVELLVAIVIVAVLASLGAVVANSAKLRANEVGCMNNLKNIGTALHVYSIDHGGRFPETSHTSDLEFAWVKALEPYLGDYDEMRVCPADPRRKDRLELGGTSYILNSFIFVPEVNEWGETVGPALNRPSAIPQPARTMLAFVCSDRVAAGPGNDHTHSNLWSGWNAVCADISPTRFGGGDDPLEPKGRSNYLYADGHVESIRAAELQQEIVAGTNIALPPGLR
ncbi:MAG: prepilin-type N-terminal cleavage/methylation domain-containing protein [Haloferula sp.]